MSAVDAYLRQARAELDRLTPSDALTRQRDGALIVDIRPEANRREEGTIPDAIVVERIVFEWRLDPTSEHRLPLLDADSEVIVVCNEGYASSLAARDAKRLGLRRATDIDGGFRAWAAAGLPVVDPVRPKVRIPTG